MLALEDIRRPCLAIASAVISEIKQAHLVCDEEACRVGLVEEATAGAFEEALSFPSLHLCRRLRTEDPSTKKETAGLW